MKLILMIYPAPNIIVQHILNMKTVNEILYMFVFLRVFEMHFY